MGTERVGRIVVETSSEAKVLFPDSGITKGELIRYYRDIAPIMLRYVRDRPLAMRRHPAGIHRDGFIQQNAPEHLPDWVETTTVAKADGDIRHILCNNAATLVYLANQNMVTPHVWLSRADQPRNPDQIVFDLDPSGDDFEAVRFAARVVREVLESDGLSTFLMTTGSSGLHVRAPIRKQKDFDDVRAYARDRAEMLADRYPDDLTVEQRKDKRKNRVYLDVGRNAYGQTAVAPYGVRALADAPVAAPIEWDELDDPELAPRRFTIRNVLQQVERRGDPMGGMARRARTLRHDR